MPNMLISEKYSGMKDRNVSWGVDGVWLGGGCEWLKGNGELRRGGGGGPRKGKGVLLKDLDTKENLRYTRKEEGVDEMRWPKG